MVLNFYNVIWDVYCVARGHIGVLFVCRLLFLGRSSFQANVRADSLIVCVFTIREGFVVYILEPRSVYFVGQTTIWLVTCAPLTFPEDLKLLLKEGLAKLCPPKSVPRKYEALHFCLSHGEPGTKGHYLLVCLSPLSGAHMSLRDVLLFQPDSL